MTDAGSIHNSKLHHVTFKTKRLQEMNDWYGTVVGTTVIHRFEGGAWLTNDDANHRIALLTMPGLVEDSDTGRRLAQPSWRPESAQLCLRVSECPDDYRAWSFKGGYALNHY